VSWGCGSIVRGRNRWKASKETNIEHRTSNIEVRPEAQFALAQALKIENWGLKNRDCEEGTDNEPGLLTSSPQ
jgi:hypothetical protein